MTDTEKLRELACLMNSTGRTRAANIVNKIILHEHSKRHVDSIPIKQHVINGGSLFEKQI
jgi:hypothetical protein